MGRESSGFIACSMCYNTYMQYHTSSKELEAYSTDSSIFKIMPTSVVYPERVEDIQEVVKAAAQEGISLSVRAGGTCMAGGSLHTGVMIDLKRHMHTVQLFPYSKSIVVEMGAYYREIESVAQKHNLMFAPYTSSKDSCGIGGMIGNNASGEKSVRHGAVIDNVHAITAVLYDGEVYTFEEISEKECAELAKKKTVIGNIYKTIRHMYKAYGHDYARSVGDVKKAASGYRLERVYDSRKKTWNLANLFVGSQATLGIITSARLKLVPIPIYTRTVIVPVDNLACLPHILATIVTHNPECVETFDVHTWQYGKQSLPEDTLRVSEYFAHGEKLVVIAQFSESTQAKTDTTAQACVHALREAAPRTTYTADAALVHSMWAIRRAAFRILRDATYSTPMKKAVPCMEDIIVPISRFDVFIPRLIHMLSTYGVEFGFHGHIGDGSLRIIPIIDFTDRLAAISLIEKICLDTFALIKEMKGNISADHGDGIIRTPFLKDFYGDNLYAEVVLGIKKLFDPHGIFNNGKKNSIRVDDWVDTLRW